MWGVEEREGELRPESEEKVCGGGVGGGGTSINIKIIFPRARFPKFRCKTSCQRKLPKHFQTLQFAEAKRMICWLPYCI